MRNLLVILAFICGTVALAQQNDPPCMPAREREELMLRMKEMGRRLADVQAELEKLQTDTILLLPDRRSQRIDTLQTMIARGKRALLEMDRRIIELKDE